MTHTKETQSNTADIMDNMKLYGAPAPEKGDLDTRAGIPTADIAETLSYAMETIYYGLEQTIGEELTDKILWDMVNVIHRTCNVLDGKEDRTSLKIKKENENADGSEIQDWEVDKLNNEMENINALQSAFDEIRDTVKQSHFEISGNAWKPSKGNLYNKNKKGASFWFAEQREKEKILEKAEMLKITDLFLFASAPDTPDSQLHQILPNLNKIKNKYPNMTIATYGSNNPADRIVYNWAEQNSINILQFEPDFKNDGNKAPFKRNEKMLAYENIRGIITTGTNGIVANLSQNGAKQKIKTLKIESK